MTRLRGSITALLVASLLVACSGDDAAMTDDGGVQTGSDTAGDWSGPDVTEESTDDRAAESAGEAPADADTDGDATAPGATAASQANRRVIRTAELTLEVEDTAAARSEILAVADRAGGFAATSDLQRDRDGVIRGTITLRVPSPALNEVVDELEAIGDAVPMSRIDERDVTMESADLQARIDNLRAYEVELVALLGDVREQSSRPEDLLTIFERVRSVREEIEVLEGRLATLDDQVAMSTVRVTFNPIAEVASIGGVSWAPGETVREALAATGRALAAIADAAIWVALTAVPVLLVVLIVPALLLVGLLRWLRHRRDDPTTGGSGPASSTPAGPPAPSVD